jgi:hypothetical protein
VLVAIPELAIGTNPYLRLRIRPEGRAIKNASNAKPSFILPGPVHADKLSIDGVLFNPQTKLASLKIARGELKTRSC